MRARNAEPGSPRRRAAAEPDDERLRIALEAAQLLSWDWNLETGVVQWSGTIPSFLELPHSIPRPTEAPLPLVWPEDRERVRDAALQALQTGATTHVEFRVGDSGRVRWVAAAGRAYRDAAGRPIRLVGVLREITQYKEAEATVGLGARILDGVHDAVVSTSGSGIIRTWNLAAERMYGYGPEEAIGQPFAFLWAAVEADRVDADVLEPTRRAGTHELVARHHRRDGSDLAVDLRLTLLSDAGGHEGGFIACLNDISARVQIEEQLRQQREDLQVILDSVPAFIWYKDHDNRILRVNRRALDAVQLPLGAVEGASTYDLYPDEAARYHDDDREVIRTGFPKLGIIEPLTMASGEKRWMRTDKVPYRNANGDIVGVIVFSVDVTESLRAEEALRRAHDELERRVEMRTRDLQQAIDALRGEIVERERAETRMRQQQAELAHLLRLHTVEGMAAQLAHELSQPLSAIINFSSGLTRRLASGATPAETLQQVSQDIGREAMRAAAVVQRLRDFVRKGPPRRELCDVGRVIADAVVLIAADLKREGVTSRLELNGAASAVVDRIQIEQVVLNLLRNALQAIEEAPAGAHEIAVESRTIGNVIEVRVRDSGVGLPVNGGEPLFEPFFTTKREGLGMGLAISRSILEAHGGLLFAEPNQPRGATFVFTLPLRR